MAMQTTAVALLISLLGFAASGPLDRQSNSSRSVHKRSVPGQHGGGAYALMPDAAEGLSQILIPNTVQYYTSKVDVKTIMSDKVIVGSEYHIEAKFDANGLSLKACTITHEQTIVVKADGNLNGLPFYVASWGWGESAKAKLDKSDENEFDVTDVAEVQNMTKLDNKYVGWWTWYVPSNEFYFCLYRKRQVYKEETVVLTEGTWDQITKLPLGPKFKHHINFEYHDERGLTATFSVPGQNTKIIFATMRGGSGMAKFTLSWNQDAGIKGISAQTQNREKFIHVLDDKYHVFTWVDSNKDPASTPLFEIWLEEASDTDEENSDWQELPNAVYEGDEEQAREMMLEPPSKKRQKKEVSPKGQLLKRAKKDEKEKKKLQADEIVGAADVLANMKGNASLLDVQPAEQKPTDQSTKQKEKSLLDVQSAEQKPTDQSTKHKEVSLIGEGEAEHGTTKTVHEHWQDSLHEHLQKAREEMSNVLAATLAAFPKKAPEDKNAEEDDFTDEEEDYADDTVDGEAH